jgi:hypothetical protein
MSEQITVTQHTRQKSAKHLAWIALRDERVQQLKRETAARPATGPHNVPDAFRVLDYAPAEQDTAERRQERYRWTPWLWRLFR